MTDQDKIDKQIEEYKAAGVEYKLVDFDFKETPKDSNYQPKDIENNKEWIKDLYKNILNMSVKDDDKGLLEWEETLKAGRTREQIYGYFINVAQKKNAEQNQILLKDLFDNNEKKRILLVIKESIGDCFIISSLFKSIKEQYQDHDLYVATQPQFQPIFWGNPLVHKIINYHPVMEQELALIGCGGNDKIVDVFLYPAVATQRHLNYLSNDNVGVDLKEREV